MKISKDSQRFVTLERRIAELERRLDIVDDDIDGMVLEAVTGLDQRIAALEPV